MSTRNGEPAKDPCCVYSEELTTNLVWRSAPARGCCLPLGRKILAVKIFPEQTIRRLQTGLWVDTHTDYAFWDGSHRIGYVLEHFPHVPHPDGERGHRACFVGTELLGLVKSDPSDANHARLIASEPRVDVVVGGAGLAGKVFATER